MFLKKNNLNIEYIYAMLEKVSDKALMIMRFDDTEKALKVLKDQGVSLIESDKVYQL